MSLENKIVKIKNNGGIKILRKDIKELLQQVQDEFDERENEITYLQTQNKLLRDSAYKDLELDRMKSERDEARRLIHQGFTISDVEKKNYQDWIEEHKAKHDGKYTNYCYIFTPTGIGTAKELQCRKCGETHDFSDFSNW